MADDPKAGSGPTGGQDDGEEWRSAPVTSSRSGNIKGLAQAEQITQIAFVLPCGMLLGWGAGYVADKVLHTHWATVTGLILGIVVGMVSVIRTAMAAMRMPGTERERSGPRDGPDKREQ